MNGFKMTATSSIFLVTNDICNFFFMPWRYIYIINISNTFAKIVLLLFSDAHNVSYLMCTKEVRALF